MNAKDRLCHFSLYIIVIFALNDSSIGSLFIGNAAFLVTITQWEVISPMQDMELQWEEE